MAHVWPANLPRSLDYPEAGSDAVLAGAARAYGARIALRDRAGDLSYAHLRDAVEQTAAALRGDGVAPGDLVAVRVTTPRWFVVAYLAVLAAGAAAVPIGPDVGVAKLVDHLDRVGAGVLVLGRDDSDRFREAARDAVPLIVTVPVPAGATGEADPVDPDLVAHLQPSADGRLVRVLHRNLVANALQVACWRSGALARIDPEGGIALSPIPAAASSHVVALGRTTTVATAPLTHGVGLVGLAANLMLGATIWLPDDQRPDRLLDLLVHHDVTLLTGTADLLDLVLADPTLALIDVSGVRHVVSGGSPLGEERRARLHAAFPSASIRESYGLAEATAVVTMAPPEVPPRVSPGSVGVPVFDTEVEIRDRHGRLVPGGQIGEIWVRGPQVTEGYHGQATPILRSDGWIRTDDRGHIDETGALHLHASERPTTTADPLHLTELRPQRADPTTPIDSSEEQAS